MRSSRQPQDFVAGTSPRDRRLCSSPATGDPGVASGSNSCHPIQRSTRAFGHTAIFDPCATA
jgi:hypothetical protein